MLHASCQGHTFALNLLKPVLHTVGGLVIFVVLIEGKSEELAVLHALGFGVELVGSVGHIASIFAPAASKAPCISSIASQKLSP